MPPSQPPPSQPPLSHRAAVLVTRPQPAADRLAGRLRGHGLSVQVAPLMRIVPVAHDAAALARAPGLVFTSAHAVAMAGPGLDRPAMCVGPATADAARAAGFRVTVGPGDAAGLLPLLTGLDGWLHPRGTHVAAVLPVPGVVVYDQQALPLPDAARALLDAPAPVIVPAFSPRSARLAAAAMHGARAPLRVAAISAAAADAWTPPPAMLAVAETPDEPGVIAAIRSLAG